MDVTIAKLREDLSQLEGPARLPKLLLLGQELGKRYVRTGPGTPGALGDLSDAIAAIDEAHDLASPGDQARGHLARLLGWLLFARYGTHGGSAQDAETGIAVLGEALSYPGFSSMEIITARVALGQLHLNRAMEALNPAAARGGFTGGASVTAKADADKAIECFREVLARPTFNADIARLIQAMLTLAEAVLPLFSGNLAGFDMTKVMSAMAAVQQLQQGSTLFATPGVSGMPPPLSSAIDFSNVGPLDYPVLDLQGSAPSTQAPAPRRPAAAPAAATEPDAARWAARSRLATLSGASGQPVWEQTSALLQAGPEQLGAAELDAFIGAALNAVAAGDDDPVESGLDRLLSAVGLCLRDRRDGSGWGIEDDAGMSLAAAGHLLAATDLIPPDHPAAAAVVEALGGMLDEAWPLAAAITGQFEAYAAKVSTRPAPVAAVSELCRVVATGIAGDPALLEAAVATVSSDHFAYAALATAVQQVRLAAAVHALDRDAVRALVGSAPTGLTRLLDALVHDEPEMLRDAVDGFTGDVLEARFAAVVGASYLELTAERRNLDVAIRLLSAATRDLDDACTGLRTRSWWRLATAYRRRGAPGDSDLSRDAGVKALGGGGQDNVSAARFAGQMLGEGYSAEAFTALEVAALASGRPVDLAEDVVGVILRMESEDSPPIEVPPHTDVATAVRRTGAVALLYLHPTDDAGRAVGVLCLDPATDRLDVIANLPVNDPLLLDDPGWSAIMGRWNAGSLLVVATGELNRLAMPAVRTGAGRRLAQDMSVTYVSSGTRVVDLASRPPVPMNDAPLFVVNPRGDRDSEMADVMVLRRLFYPRSTCMGRAIELVHAAGTRDDVLSSLPDASVTHLACGLRTGGVPALLLAGGDVLDVRDSDVHGKGLVVLAKPDPGGFVSIADAFLDAGFSSVIGWQWPVPAPYAELALFMTHLMLVDRRLPPGSAVNAVHRWMLDPDRDLAPLLTGAHVKTVETVDLTRPALWAALACRGC
ncbi:CHAT domain-containing protein [Kribbella sp. VKM Ac-2569]|uniref:CHAT domain-containing protein n=1 Tax=Kribbella sp. VKM Ac-2569 TaxID=2512220 RepID=UPI00102ACB06|nr:CHAT domain-containing protein [Kribbella sp. VKM Ac-2569]RZT17499.1 CHAT domain-containing protein [Kribbella sp. VKM Ac-2569]